MPCPVCEDASDAPWFKDWTRFVESPAADTCARCRVILKGVRMMRPKPARENSDPDRLQLDGIFRDSDHQSHIGIYQGEQTRFIEFYVLPGTPSAHRPSTASQWPSLSHLPARVELGESAEIIRRWMQICQREHPECSNTPQSSLPTRVIDVGTIQLEEVRLHTTAKTDTGPFVALSYCWGTSGNLTTTISNLAAHSRAIPWPCIPKIMRDAIQITRELGIRYIWIDALCIVQDDPQDWNREAAQMKDIYTNACLVISGTRAGDCHQSLFGERRASATGSGERVPTSFSHELVVSDDDQPPVYVREALGHDLLYDAKQDLERHRLLGRGWTFQERLLATRTAHFTSSELMWECNQGFMCECGSAQLDGSLSLLRRALQAPNEASSHWKKIVRAYSARSFTSARDRLVALDGVTHLFKDLGWGSYSFGLWEKDIVGQMLWQALPDNRNAHAEALPEAYRSVMLGPSWSWVSTNREVGFSLACRPIATVVVRLPTAEPAVSFRDAIAHPPAPLATWKLTVRTKVRRGIFEHKPCQWQKCQYRVLLEVPGPRTGWPVFDFYPDIIVCPEHQAADSDRVNSKWLDEGQVVECVLLADVPAAGLDGGSVGGLFAGLVVKTCPEEPGLYFRVGFFKSSWLEVPEGDTSSPSTVSPSMIWDGIEESVMTLV